MNETATPPRFAIINDSDRPCSNNVVQYVPIANCYCYLVPRPGEKKVRFLHDLDPAEATSMLDFGFEITLSGSQVTFRRIGPSQARYRDGKLREWQELSLSEFTLPMALATSPGDVRIPKPYRYTLLKTDGTAEVLCVRKKPMSLDEMLTALGVDVLQLIAPPYYEGKGWGKCQVYGDDEGRVPNYTPNPHFHTIVPMFSPGLPADTVWDVPGDCLRVDRSNQMEAR